ncbi:unnamed protein product [Boreogadus saida]
MLTGSIYQSGSATALPPPPPQEGAVGATITLSVPRRRREPISMKNRSTTRTREDRTQLWMNKKAALRSGGTQGLSRAGVEESESCLLTTSSSQPSILPGLQPSQAFPGYTSSLPDTATSLYRPDTDHIPYNSLFESWHSRRGDRGIWCAAVHDP